MKKIGPSLFLLGFIFLVLGVGVKFYFERDFYKDYIERQQDIIKQDILTKWRNLIASKLDNGEFKNVYTLNWKRDGSSLNEKFFPQEEVDQKLWRAYRKAEFRGKKYYLNDALERYNSWDRVLAIKTLLKTSNQKFEKKDLSKYELTLIDKEAKKAYEEIYKVFERNYDLKIDSNYRYADVFIKKEEDGSIRGSVPWFDELKTLFEREFQPSIKSEIKLNSYNILKIDVLKIYKDPKLNPRIQIIVIATSFLMMLFGSIFSFLDSRNSRKEVLKKITFLNQVVHEIKTPLTGLKLDGQLLMKYGNDESVLKRLNQNIDRINKLFDDIVLINSKDSKVLKSEVLLEEIINQLDFPKLKIINNCEEKVSVDPLRLKIVLSNLIQNAFKYAQNCELNIYKKNNQLFLEVIDDGPGILSSESSKIFEEFYRSKKGKEKSPDGIGLGLSICKKLCAQMDGKIILVNPGKGGAHFQVVVNV